MLAVPAPLLTPTVLLSQDMNIICFENRFVTRFSTGGKWRPAQIYKLQNINKPINLRSESLNKY